MNHKNRSVLLGDDLVVKVKRVAARNDLRPGIVDEKEVGGDAPVGCRCRAGLASGMGGWWPNGCQLPRATDEDFMST